MELVAIGFNDHTMVRPLEIRPVGPGRLIGRRGGYPAVATQVEHDRFQKRFGLIDAGYPALDHPPELTASPASAGAPAEGSQAFFIEQTEPIRFEERPSVPGPGQNHREVEQSPCWRRQGQISPHGHVAGLECAGLANE